MLGEGIQGLLRGEGGVMCIKQGHDLIGAFTSWGCPEAQEKTVQ